ncbi:MAG: hypothetical protein HRT88_16565, partial [Lentisphaeraceae bacterium]|nr:hypothetical protein [Lentisphaeraceae bacterium]
MKIKSKITLAGATTIIPLIIIAIVTFQLAKKNSVDDSEKLLINHAETAALQLNLFLEKEVNTVKRWYVLHLAELYAAIEYDDFSGMPDKFQEMTSDSSNFIVLALADKNGKILAHTLENESENIQELLSHSAKKGLEFPSFSSNYVAATSLAELGLKYDKTALFSFPIHEDVGEGETLDTAKIKGTLIAFLNWNSLDPLLDKSLKKLTNSGFTAATITLMDKTSLKATNHNLKELRGKSIVEDKETLNTWLKDEKQNHSIPLQYQGELNYFFKSPVSIDSNTKQFSLILTEPESEILIAANEILKISIIVASVGGGICLVLIFLIAQKIYKP